MLGASNVTVKYWDPFPTSAPSQTDAERFAGRRCPKPQAPILTAQMKPEFWSCPSGMLPCFRASWQLFNLSSSSSTSPTRRDLPCPLPALPAGHSCAAKGSQESTAREVAGEEVASHSSTQVLHSSLREAQERSYSSWFQTTHRTGRCSTQNPLLGVTSGNFYLQMDGPESKRKYPRLCKSWSPVLWSCAYPPFLPRFLFSQVRFRPSAVPRVLSTLLTARSTSGGVHRGETKKNSL